MVTGVLGGFTTYSSFNYETLHLAQSGAAGFAVINVALTVIAGLGGHRGIGVARLGRAERTVSAELAASSASGPSGADLRICK